MNSRGHSSGTAKELTGDLMDAFCDPEVDLVRARCELSTDRKKLTFVEKAVE